MQTFQTYETSGDVLPQFGTACGHRMAHRKWKENKLQPGTAGPSNMLGCSLISFHFRWAILCPQAVYVSITCIQVYTYHSHFKQLLYILLRLSELHSRSPFTLGTDRCEDVQSILKLWFEANDRSAWCVIRGHPYMFWDFLTPSPPLSAFGTDLLNSCNIPFYIFFWANPPSPPPSVRTSYMNAPLWEWP